MKDVALSIIIPTYNSGNHIQGCLDSILNQTLKKFEIIVQDGKSTDKTVEIVQKYIEADKRINSFHRKKLVFMML